MTTYIESPDGATIARTLPELPAEHWVQDTPTTGRYVDLDAGNAASHGYYVLTENAQPDDDHVRSIENTSRGVFVETWTFDQGTADANADEADRQTRRQRIAADPVSVLEARAQFYRDAPATTTANVVAHVRVIRGDLEKLYDLLADIIRATNLDQ